MLSLIGASFIPILTHVKTLSLYQAHCAVIEKTVLILPPFTYKQVVKNPISFCKCLSCLFGFTNVTGDAANLGYCALHSQRRAVRKTQSWP